MTSTTALPGATPYGSRGRRSFPIEMIALMLGIAAVLAAIGLSFGKPNWLVHPSARIGPVASRIIPPARPLVEDQRLVPLAPEAARALNAERPLVAAPLVAARPFRLVAPPEAMARATDCLAAAGWYEIGDDPRGQRAVMQVVLNRVRHPAFPTSVCSVVFQGSDRSTGCQFTFTCDGALLHRAPSVAAWTRARAIATAALAGAVDREVGLATHYHADYVVPYWASSLDKSAEVGPHLFYRWRGFWGTGAAFARRGDGDEPTVAALANLSTAHRPADTGLPAIAVPVGAELAAAVPPPAIAVTGVREKSLRGAVVRGEAAESGRYFLQLDGSTFPGNYATAAVALCKGKPGCVVLGWRDVTQLGQSLPLSTPQREALSFYYAQGSDGTGKALWNCQQMPRANRAQCLGAGDPA